jgi:hypothetical protein
MQQHTTDSIADLNTPLSMPLCTHTTTAATATTTQVRMWDAELTPTRTFDLTGRSALRSSHIRAVCLNDKGDSRKILVGTRGSDVLEISTAESGSGDEELVKKTDNLILNGGVCLTSGHRCESTVLFDYSAHTVIA